MAAAFPAPHLPGGSAERYFLTLPIALRLSSFGVPVEIALADPSLRAALESVLPPGHVETTDEPLGRFVLTDVDELGDLDAALRHCIAVNAPRHVFVHAGVVTVDDRALVLPGPTFAGKSELVAALLRAGAAYGSDEFAVLGPDGLVHPYPRSLSLRREGRDVPAAAFGAPVADHPVPVGAIAFTRYEPGAAWDPDPVGPADAALRLLEHAGQVRAAPERVLGALRAAVDGAVVVEGPRGEAGDAVPGLLGLLA